MVVEYAQIPQLALVWIGCAVVTALIAAWKGRNTTRWLIGGLLFGPIALIAILVFSRNYSDETWDDDDY